MNLTWFNETTYLLNKLAQLQRRGEPYSTTEQVSAGLKANGMTPWQHYTSFGDDEGINPHASFNRTEYLRAKAAQLNALKFESKTTWDEVTVAAGFKALGLTAGEHFALYGWKENVNPSNDFDVSTYFADKWSQVRKLPGNDPSGKPYADYTLDEVKAEFEVNGLDPLSHYALFGKEEGIGISTVPSAERVASDTARPQMTVLASDGLTITVHLQSPIVAESIEAADFFVSLGGKSVAITTVAPGPDTLNYDIVITLDSTQRIPWLPNTVSTNIVVGYNPDGGSTAVLTTEDGPVSAFTQSVGNQSKYFQIAERVVQEDVSGSAIKVLKISLTPPPNFVPPTDETKFVKVDLAATAGVVSGGEFGLPTSPRLMDGATVQKLDTTAVAASVSLDIITGPGGHVVFTGKGADKITLGEGEDKVVYHDLTTTQLFHMDAIHTLAFGVDKLVLADDSGTALLNTIEYKGPLSLEGDLTESAIRGVFNKDTMTTGTGYLILNGLDYVLVADVNGDGMFTASNDFALSLVGIAEIDLANLNDLLG